MSIISGLGKMRQAKLMRQVFLAIAWISVAVGVIYSLVKQPEMLTNIVWYHVVLIIVFFTPLSLICNAFGFIQSGKIVNQKQRLDTALNVTTSGTLANQLPVPAAFIMRVSALRLSGAGMVESIHATITISVIWVGCNFLISAIAAYKLHAISVFILLVSIGLVACVYGIVRFWGKSGNLFIAVFATGCLLSFLDALRLYASFKALGVTPTIAECFFLTAASAVSNIATFVPGGIGVREYGAAALSTLTDIPPTYTILAVTINRLAGLIGAALLLLYLSFRKSDSMDKG